VSLFSMNRPPARPTDNRKRISRQEMQAAITEAVKKADPDCEPFVGVIVERTKRSSLAEANWAIRGIKFGSADRNKASDAATTVVERNANSIFPTTGSARTGLIQGLLSSRRTELTTARHEKASFTVSSAGCFRFLTLILVRRPAGPAQ
jgi:hypothetical protein